MVVGETQEFAHLDSSSALDAPDVIDNLYHVTYEGCGKITLITHGR